MSTYLNAFFIGDFAYIDNNATKGPDDTYMRVIVRPDQTTKTPFALENTENALKALESYVDFEYEISKMDSAGVPNKGNAMENWYGSRSLFNKLQSFNSRFHFRGLLKYRENALIYTEDILDTPHTQIFSGVRVISHEV
jgi:hypothetical protein